MKLQSQSHLQRRNLVKQLKNMVLFVVLFLIVSLLEVIESRFHVQTLPGFVGNLPITLETGYIGVGEAENEQLFYYFVESEGNPKKDPLMIWASPGPGCSTLTWLMGNTGPITLNKTIPTSEEAIFEINPYRLTKAVNILYIDQPVGTGFSFAKNSEAYITNDVLSTTKAYRFLKKWFMDHPKFLNNPFYLGGGSYNGIILPMIAQEIYNGNEAGEYPQINIKGYLIGNPLTAIHDDYNSRITFAHRVALISDAIYESTKENCHGEYFNVDPNNTLCVHDLQVVFKCLERINEKNILDPICDTLDTFKNSHLFRRSLASSKDNWLLPQAQAQPCSEDSYFTAWANRRDVREALHVSEVYGKIKWETCNESMVFDYRKKSKSYTNNIASSVAYHKHLTYSNCRALIYSGDHDAEVPYLGTLNWIKSLNLSLVDDWRPWFFDKQVAGYTMKYSASNYNLTFATVKGGGHASEVNKLKESSSMLTRWLSNNAL